MTRAPNNIGILRLALASAVIIGHAPEIIDGNRNREPLTALFGTLSLGEVAVDGFFLISGYLIAAAMIRAPSVGSYLNRRFLRIVPAYVVAFLICAFVVAPIGGGHGGDMVRTLGRMALLQTPQDTGEFHSLAVHAVNGSMWTISYEFRCYLLVAVLGIVGALSRPRVILALAGIAAVAGVAATFAPVKHALDSRSHAVAFIGALAPSIRLLSVFMLGVAAYSYRDTLSRRITGPVAMACAVAMIPALVAPHLAELALTTLGGVVLYWLAFRANIGRLQRINSTWDISYGVYLYGWPVSMLLVWFNRGIDPAALAAATLPIAFTLGAASWFAVEQWPTRITNRFQGVRS